MYKIRVLNKIADKGLKSFSTEHYQIGAQQTNPEGLLLRSHKLNSEDINQELRAIARAGVGVNNIPVAECTKRGIVVFNTPGANANSVKELVIAALLNSSRGIIQGSKFTQQLTEKTPLVLNNIIETNKKHFQGREIADRTIGIVGLGYIGSLVANSCLELGMRVFGLDPNISVEAAWRLSRGVEKKASLAALLANSDYVSLHVPLLDATRNLINADNLKLFKKNSVLLNYSRAEIVDNQAVIAVLDKGNLHKYYSDFPAPELIGREDCFLTPHLGASTIEAEENCALMAARELQDFLQTGNITNSVNFPSTQTETSFSHRLVIINRNIPNMIRQISTVLGEAKINVADMANKSRGDIAYNLIDMNNPIKDSLLAELTAIENVYRAYRI